MKDSLSRRRWGKLRGSACPRQGAEQRMIDMARAAVRDKREIRRLESELSEERSARMACRRLLTAVSHDIRTPVNAIIGMVEIAKEHLDDRRRTSECLKQILRATEHLLALIEDVLDVSGLENGGITLQESPCALGDLVESALAMVRVQASSKAQKLSADIGAVRHRMLRGDAVRINRILVNLLSNAIKYTQEGGTVHVIVEELTNGHTGYARLRFIVRDNGIGMSPETMARVFQPYTRDASSATIQGTGLGLAITKALVDAMGGTIAVESRLGEGSTFAVTLELKIDSGQRAGAAEPMAYLYDGKRILLAEDNEMSADVMRELLEERGASVERAADGHEAVELLLRHPVGYYDAALMDVMMPRMNGYQAAQTIRALNRADARMLPIVAMTGAASPEDARAALESGMDAHVVKPVDLTMLARALGRATACRARSSASKAEKSEPHGAICTGCDSLY